MRLHDLLPLLDRLAPLRFAEAWDNTGLLTGDPSAEVQRVLLTIDLTHAVADEALAAGCSLVVAYHPTLFQPIQRVRHDSVLYRAIRGGLAIWSPHTALDVAPGGTNDLLAELVGLQERRPLRLTVPAEQAGLGRIGTLAPGTTREQLIDRVKRGLGLAALLVAGPRAGPVSRAAVCAGAGRDLLKDALAQRADLFLTGELPHHDALAAAAAGTTVLCALHSNSERAALRGLAERLRLLAPGLDVQLSQADRDPYEVV